MRQACPDVDDIPRLHGDPVHDVDHRRDILCIQHRTVARAAYLFPEGYEDAGVVHIRARVKHEPRLRFAEAAPQMLPSECLRRVCVDHEPYSGIEYLDEQRRIGPVLPDMGWTEHLFGMRLNHLFEGDGITGTAGDKRETFPRCVM